MSRYLKIIKYTAIGILGVFIILILSIFIFYKFFYYSEFNSIKKNLQKNDKVEIIKMWGNEDVTFEDISVVLKVKNKGILLIYGISKDVNNFPKSVYITEIGKFSFVNFSCQNSMSWNLNVGTESDFGKKTGIVFNNVDDVINHYDDINKYVESFKIFPEYNYLKSNGNPESILFINKGNNMNYENLKKYYNSECIADLQNEINKIGITKPCR